MLLYCTNFCNKINCSDTIFTRDTNFVLSLIGLSSIIPRKGITPQSSQWLIFTVPIEIQNILFSKFRNWIIFH